MQELLHMPRLLVGAPQGRSGKTTVTVGLIAGFRYKGLTVQPFKKGLDFIDPSWLSLVAGRSCRNLDSYLMSREDITGSFATHTQGADIAIVEGAMGLFDGVDVAGSGSAAEIAKAIQAPVLLVVDTTRMTRSVAALVNGFKHFDPAVQIAGVVLNKVARSRHEKMLRAAIEEYCGIPVLGAMPKGTAFTIPDRHLGLIPAGENEKLLTAVNAVRDAALQYLDLDGILNLTRQWPPLPVSGRMPKIELNIRRYDESMARRQRQYPVVGVLQDRSFSFYYPENLEAIVRSGATLITVDALHDLTVPDVDALYIGGGFPEVLAAELSENVSFRQDLRRKIETGLPVYAECGGLMYLGRQVCWRESCQPMVGIFDFDVEVVDKPQGHGYMKVEALAGNKYFPAGTVISGHEFHNSRIVNLDPEKAHFAFNLLRGHGIDGRHDGLIYKNVLAAYNHIHAVAVPAWAPRLVAMAREYMEHF